VIFSYNQRRKRALFYFTVKYMDVTFTSPVYFMEKITSIYVICAVFIHISFELFKCTFVILQYT